MGKKTENVGLHLTGERGAKLNSAEKNLSTDGMSPSVGYPSDSHMRGTEVSTSYSKRFGETDESKVRSS
jgi:hypothetical protein